MLDILQKERLTLTDMQEFHKALDTAKNFDTDFVRNVAYMIAEVGEVLNAFRLIDKSRATKSQSAVEVKANRDHVAEELADCLAYVIKLANYADIDLESAYVAKMSHNVSRTWPPTRPPKQMESYHS